jgi:hypothetical protein
MTTRDGRPGGHRFDRLAAITRLLDEYQATKDRQLLRRAIELWHEVKVTRLPTTGQSQIH